MLKIRLLGTFDLRQAGKPVALSSRPAQSLLAYLILNAGTAHRREKLAGLLWPDSLEETARDNLRHALWRLRKALSLNPSTRSRASPPISYLLTDDFTIAFNASADYWLDVAELKKLNDRASIEELLIVLSVYRGPLLPGFYDEWVVLEREHLHAVFEHHMARLMALLQDQKRWLDTLDWGERWVKLGQKPEPAYRALMLAYAAKGDMYRVAATYERYVKSLGEFGIEPSEQIKELYERFKAGQGHLETRATVFVIDERKSLPKTNLPVPITSFIGREKEVEEVINLVGRYRLITLTGSGGVGKTRLAIQASSQMLSTFQDGVWWVELAPLVDETLAPQAVAQALGMREISDEQLVESVKLFLREKQMLLIFDNCEHLITGCAQLADDLLAHCADLKILVTSREVLDITGEMVYQVPTLSLPKPETSHLVNLLLEYESIRLFAERAFTRSGFTLTEANAAAVVQICQRLDGIPLALELAAARTKLLAVEEIAKRLNDHLNLLAHGSRTALPRHQTLRAAIDWSYELLPREEQTLFRRLAVFAGGWTLQEIQAVCSGDDIGVDEILDLLGYLRDKSLVIMQTENGHARYRMLETIRQYAHEKFMNSIEAERVQKRHLEFFVQFAEEADPNLNGPEQVAWLDHLGTEHANFRAALGWALEHHEFESAARLGTGLFWFWVFRTHLNEGLQWLEQIIKLSRRMAQTEQMSPSAKALFAHVLNRASLLAYYRGKQNLARSLADEGLALSRRIKNNKLIIEALLPLGFVLQNQGDYARAGILLEEKLALSRDVGEKWDVARALVLLGNLALNQNDYISARIRYEEGLSLSREIGHRLFISIFSNNLGHVALNESNYAAARELYTEAVLLAREVGSKRYMIIPLVGWAGLARALGQLERATKLSGAVEALYESISSGLEQEEQVEHERTIAVSRSQLDEATFNQLWHEGRAMTLEQSIKYALNIQEPSKPNISLKEKFGGLTTREREAAFFIAQGKSNREIAKEMVVGVRTVETYVTRILNKLGFDSRVQIAMWAIEKGLSLSIKSNLRP